MGVFPHTTLKQIRSTYDPIAEDVSLFIDLPIRVLSDSSMPKYTESLSKGIYDFGLVGPIQYVQHAYKAGYRPISRRDTTFQFEYVALPSNHFNNLSSLANKTVGLITPTLKEHAIAYNLVKKFDESLPDKINIKQIQNLAACFHALHIKLVDACGAISTIVKVFEKQNNITYSVLAQSLEMPNATYVIHKDVDKENAELIKEYFLTRPEQIKANDKDYDVIRELIH